MMAETRRGPAVSDRAISSPSCDAADSTSLDRQIVGDADLWAALFDGRFRLAVRCDVCGRWLTAGKSKANGRGPNCAARAVGK